MAYLTLGFSIVSFIAAGVIALTTPATSGLMKAHAVRTSTSSQSPASPPPVLR
ncbi:hypothetical protein [Phenylobacterium sp.]|uniref:hypothetical protein n=1 Tax=Phenylobacterium sp. TaxID=1871053 RepID=UPI002600006D|nr:hypothetical protein [Phenylobacterium sp.]